jgi:CDP-diglyceride synthetase
MVKEEQEKTEIKPITSPDKSSGPKVTVDGVIIGVIAFGIAAYAAVYYFNKKKEEEEAANTPPSMPKPPDFGK